MLSGGASEGGKMPTVYASWLGQPVILQVASMIALPVAEWSGSLTTTVRFRVEKVGH